MKSNTRKPLSVIAALFCVAATLAPSAASAQTFCGPPPPPPAATKWRIRNASVQGNTGQWVLREMAFCADASCSQVLTGGTAIDSGASASWALPQYAFDGNTSTFWKTFDTNVAGQSWLGIDFGAPRGVHGIYLKTDNVVYSVDTIYVDYYDANLGSWVTADILYDVPSGSELIYDVKIRRAFPVSWRIRNASAQQHTGQWVLREMAFCADASCSQVLTGGTAIDSGASASWALPQYAFDGNTSTFWKTFDTNVAGQSWLGMSFDEITNVKGVYLKTDNVVYSVDSMFVEYYDAVARAWVTADTIESMPSGSDLTYGLACQ